MIWGRTIVFVEERFCTEWDTKNFARFSGMELCKSEQLEIRDDLSVESGKGGNTMAHDSHVRAAELHDLAAHAHRAAAMHHGKEDHQTGHEHSEQALEHANRALESSRIAQRKSTKSAGKQ